MSFKPPRTDRRILRVCQLLQEELPSRLTVAHLAASLSLSVSRTGHLFKEKTGMALGQYIKALEMTRAKDLLEASSLSVKEIMGKLGRSSQSHFCHDFKISFGISPGKYRSQLPTPESREHRPQSTTEEK